MQFPSSGTHILLGCRIVDIDVSCIYATASLLTSFLDSCGDDVGLVLQHASLPTSP